MTQMDTDGGPLADGKQANNEYGLFWLNWCPQADDVGERELSGIKRELKKKLFMEINGIFMAIHVQKLSMLFWGWTRIIGNYSWIEGKYIYIHRWHGGTRMEVRRRTEDLDEYWLRILLLGRKREWKTKIYRLLVT